MTHDLSRFGYHSDDDVRYAKQQEQANDNPERIKKTIATLKKLAETDPSVRPALAEAERRLTALLQHA